MAATVQDFFNMAMSLSVGNKSGTNKTILLPDDLRKIADMKVAITNQRHATVSAGTGPVPLNADSSSSFFLAIFSHPVRITQITNQSIGAGDEAHASFVCFGRNYPGSGNFKNVFLRFTNDLLGPNYTSTTGTGTTADVDYIELDFSFVE